MRLNFSRNVRSILKFNASRLGLSERSHSRNRKETPAGSLDFCFEIHVTVCLFPKKMPCLVEIKQVPR